MLHQPVPPACPELAEWAAEETQESQVAQLLQLFTLRLTLEAEWAGGFFRGCGGWSAACSIRSENHGYLGLSQSRRSVWGTGDPLWEEIGGILSETRSKLRKLTMLTPFEDHCWVFAFNYYLDERKSEEEADRLAWRDLQWEYPRLRAFDGCLPDTPREKTNPKWSSRPVVVRPRI